MCCEREELMAEEARRLDAALGVIFNIATEPGVWDSFQKIPEIVLIANVASSALLGLSYDKELTEFALKKRVDNLEG